ncbi:DUF2577 domain-containing protein [Heliophilum fasciatum]|uniref:Uncharacterized protein DUF2577 n=1 Tax=Heliophilum fasciatum TaxID=35700 RepID=A0A4R2RP19_9FIRM|nr:DUF2577 domain-containing protein [Heliophilum fasciatum]MCW2277727.1 hypothetical protein [Heliophilum fasciatum]TCP64778.1 uncharacterized protein DUF2577 [Heliophilum fasciatum]
MLDAIKRAGLAAVEAGNPVAILFGTVTGVNPLEVNVEQRFTLTEDFLVVPERMIHYEVDLTHKHDYIDTPAGEKKTQTALSPLVIRKRLEVGENVLLMRVQGGQRYVILDRVVAT